MNFLRFILRRAVYHWQILFTLMLGVILATGLLASGPLLVDTVVEFGLRNTLLAGDTLSRHLRVTLFSAAQTQENYMSLDEAMRGVFQRRFAGYLSQVVPQAGAPWLFPWQDGTLLDRQRVRVSFDGLLLAETELIAGTFPNSPILNDNTILVAISEEMAEAYQLEPGDLLPVNRSRNNETPDLFLQIAGIVRPINPRADYWSGTFNPLKPRSDTNWQAQYNCFIPPDQFFNVMESYFQGSRAELYWNVLLEPTQINIETVGYLQTQLNEIVFELLEISPTHPVLETELGQLLSRFAEQLNAIRAPILLLTAEVVLLALYYVVMIAALSVKTIEREFAVLHSRGASAGQLFRVQAGEALLISLLAFVAGPFVGVALIRGLGVMGPLGDMAAGSWNLSLTQSAWLAAIAGSLACLTGLLIPVVPAVQRTIVTQTRARARDDRPPLWQRLYLDIFLLLGGLLLLWRLRLVGGIVNTGGIDWLLLLSPLALLLGTGTILLRLFPLLLRIAAALATQSRGLTVALAMWQTSRHPAHLARLVLLLTLAMSLGLLATGINATLDLSELERARYAVGSDMRLVSQFLPLGKLQGISTIAGNTVVYRTTGSMATVRESQRFDLLGIDAQSFGQLAEFRADFADEPMAELLQKLQTEGVLPDSALPLPGQPDRISLWLYTPADNWDNTSDLARLEGDSNFERLALLMKVQTHSGQLLDVKLLPAETEGYPVDGWREFSGTFSLGETDYPIAVQSLWLTNRARAGFFSNSVFAEMVLGFDDLMVRDRISQKESMAVDFEQAESLWQLGTSELDGIELELSSTNPHSGRRFMLGSFAFLPRGAVSLVVDQLAGEGAEMPALINQTFLAATNVQVGSPIELTVASVPMKFRVVGVVQYFPTLYDNLDIGYIITSRQQLLTTLNRIKTRSVNPNELLLQLDTNANVNQVSEEATAIAPDIAQLLTMETVRRTIKADPMALGLRSVTFFGYVLTTVLSLVGFATHFYLSARQQESAYAILRSIGVSSLQLYTLLILEQLILILFGLGLGTLLGVVLNQITLPGLPITLGDALPIPPFIPRTDWLAVGRIYILLAVGFLAALGIATWLLWRRNLHRTLRIGEE